MDLIEETREAAAKNLRKYGAVTQLWYNKKVAPKAFRPGDVVLRCALSPGKLQNKWEGPILVIGSGTGGACRLAELDGTPLPHPWNANLLRRYYI